jgi:RNA polymerase sigma factor (TIGR02999 family)
MNSERADHTLEPTALVHEGVLRLLGGGAVLPAENRRLFFGAVVQAMRRVLIDHARRRNAARRGGAWERQPLDDTLLALEQTHQVDLLALDEQLKGLETAAPRAAEVVTLRFFGGLENREIAEQLGVSLSAVEKDWRFARAWLHRRLGES